jgi:hypothetical protein
MAEAFPASSYGGGALPGVPMQQCVAETPLSMFIRGVFVFYWWCFCVLVSFLFIHCFQLSHLFFLHAKTLYVCFVPPGNLLGIWDLYLPVKKMF